MEEVKSSNFIYDIIDTDLAEGTVKKIHTRFPPEPNGYLHIGSAKAILINYDTAKKYGGSFNLRYDDTNPTKEDVEFVDSIYKDICWLIGDEPDGGIFYGSDYFEKCYEYAVKLIKDGKAYVCDLSKEDVAEYKGTDRSEASRVSPYRDRSVEENLELFERMKNGEFPEGSHTLRAKIDPTSPNTYLRDPIIYRIKFCHHHRQGDKWCIYPMYDFAHPIQDATETISHSLCSLEFENHRPLYEWVVDNIGFDPKPKQREFARLNVTNTVMSKRYLRYLVENDLVDGWDDPRLPTLCALRRRGYTASSVRTFIRSIGVSKAENLVDIRMLEACIRDELNENAARRICIEQPIKVVITNFPEGKEEIFDLPNHPQKPEMGTRPVTFTRELYIDKSDFEEVPPPKFFRMKPDGEVRLMGAYIVRCNEIIKNEDGSVKELHCTADLETGNGMPADGRKIKGTIHWVSADTAVDVTLKQYNELFTIENTGDIPQDENGSTRYNDYLNPESCVTLTGAKAEPALANVTEGERFQFVRCGYYCKDTKHPGTFNRIVKLKDSFPKK
ncbi:MAG: glutamine--tRNA ligase/YqeY domain fusion protein [Ruminococcaceae bacterium]|nr:glutamine--tRNA ligase/YqeY domain fusion protein [Oscillospiraceae bacterium]